MQTIQIEGQTFELVPQYRKRPQDAFKDKGTFAGYLLKPIETQPEKRWDVDQQEYFDPDHKFQGHEIRARVNCTYDQSTAIREAVEALMKIMYQSETPCGSDYELFHDTWKSARQALQKEGNTHV